VRADLQKAHDAAELRGTLDEALLCPLLKRCLEITARALLHQADTVPPPAAGAPTRWPTRPFKHPSAPRPDFKRASAADVD
jgi:hypothetical protein